VHQTHVTNTNITLNTVTYYVVSKLSESCCLELRKTTS